MPAYLRSFALAMLFAVLAAAASGASGAAAANPLAPPIVERFFTIDNRPPAQYRALRRLDARNGKFNAEAWMDVWTEADERGFRYQIAARGGSGYIHSKVFVPSLETEKRMWSPDAEERGAINLANYAFEDRGAEPQGLAWIGVKPRRKDLLLIDGSIFLNPLDADLVRIHGTLSKTPSFWTRRVEVTRHYQRINGVRLPVTMETTANVLIAGKSTFTTTFEYETVNGQRIASPEPRPGE